MTQPSKFGPMVDGGQVEQWVADTLELWFPTYLRELEDQRGLPHGQIPPPLSYTISEDVDREAGDYLPALVVVSPGLASGRAPQKEGDGAYRAWWNVGIGIFASSNSRNETRILVRRYLAVARTLLIQKRSLGGNANGIDWLDEDYEEVDFETGATMGAGVAFFNVEVANVLMGRGGPRVPDPDPVTQPGSTDPHVTGVNVTTSLEGR